MINCFLRLEGVEGECADASHPGWIPIQNFALWPGRTQRKGVSKSHRTAGDIRETFRRPRPKAPPIV